MKLAAVLVSVLLSGQASAAVHTYDFTAKVVAMGEMFLTYEPVPDTPFPGEVIALDGLIKGRISYDDATPLKWDSGSDQASYASATASQIHLAFVGSGRTFAFVGNEVRVYDNSAREHDRVDFSSPWYSWGHVGVGFVGDGHGVLSSRAIPSHLTLEAFPNSSVFMFWQPPSSGQMHWAAARMDSLVEVSAVPEPSSMAMLLAGLGGLAIGARRRSRAG